MTKLNEVAPDYEKLEDGTSLQMIKVEFDKFNYEGEDVDRAVITDKTGKKYSTTSQVIISKLRRKEVEEFFANLKGDDSLDVKVKSVQSSKKKNQSYLTFE